MKAKYNQVFKDEAVALALSSDLPYAQIAKDLGLHYQTFGNWMRKAMSEKLKWYAFAGGCFTLAIYSVVISIKEFVIFLLLVSGYHAGCFH